MMSRRMALAMLAISSPTMALAPALARDLPDLVITQVALKPSGSCGKGRVLISGRIDIKNVGQGRGQIFTTKEMVRSHVRSQPRIRGGDRFVNSMRPGETVTVDIRIGTKGPYTVTGRQTIVLQVDPENVFKEENEANNTATAEVVLSCP